MSTAAKASYFFRTAVFGIIRSPFIHAVAVGTIAVALTAFGLGRMVENHVESLVQALGGEVELTVYIRDGATPDERRSLAQALSARTGAAATEVSPDAALGRLKESLGDQGRALDSLKQNPLPWSLELALPAGAREPTALKALATAVRELPFVESVDFGEAALDRLTAMAKALRLGSAAVFFIVFVVTIVVVSATLQLAIYSRREEIEIQKLVGGTDRFVRAPFLLEGVTQGVLGATLATLALWALKAAFGDDVRSLLAFINLREAQGGTLALVGELFALGMLLGLVGSVVAVRRFLRV